MSCIKTTLNRHILLLSWLALVVLSLLSVTLGEETSRWAVYGILLAAMLKGWLIVDHFMELRHVRLFWRMLLLAWPVTVVFIIGLLYRYA